MGNLTRDPEIKHTSKGTAIAELSVAVNRKVPDGKDGWKNEPTFVEVTAWGSTAENAHKYLTKGRGVFIEGRLQIETWEDKATGQKRSKLKVVCEALQFLPDAKSTTERSHSPSPAAPTPSAQDDDCEDLPF
jgi:single-strand DNA-binding protein